MWCPFWWEGGSNGCWHKKTVNSLLRFGLSVPCAILPCNQHSRRSAAAGEEGLNQQPEPWKPQRRCHVAKTLRYTCERTDGCLAEGQGAVHIRDDLSTAAWECCLDGKWRVIQGNTDGLTATRGRESSPVQACGDWGWLFLNQRAFGDLMVGSGVTREPAASKRLPVLYRATARCAECVALRLT